MILEILSYRNKLLKSYTNPTYFEGKLDNVEESLYRSLVLGGAEVVKKNKNLALYRFGTFDDQTGKYDLLKEPELLCDLDDLIAKIPGGES